MTREQIFRLSPVSQIWEPLTLDPETIIEIVSGYYKVKEEDVLSTCQLGELVWVRQVSMYFISHFTKLKSREVIKYFPGRGGRTKDRSNVSHSISVVLSEMKASEFVKSEIRKIEYLLQEQDVFHRYKRTA